MAITASKKDLGSGAIFVAAGAYFALEAMNYDIGTPFRMGPGFMPVFLGVILILLGLGVAAAGLRKPDQGETFPVPLRALVLILGTIVFFAATVRGLGFVPVVFLSALASALASRTTSIGFALLLSAGLCVLCTLIFVVGLGLIVPWFGPWLPF